MCHPGSEKPTAAVVPGGGGLGGCEGGSDDAGELGAGEDAPAPPAAAAAAAAEDAAPSGCWGVGNSCTRVRCRLSRLCCALSWILSFVVGRAQLGLRGKVTIPLFSLGISSFIFAGLGYDTRVVYSLTFSRRRRALSRTHAFVVDSSVSRVEVERAQPQRTQEKKKRAHAF
jgi:hypothetical protein